MKKQWLVLGFLSMEAVAAHAGTVVHLERRSLPDGTFQPHSIIYAQDGQFRMDSLDVGGHVQDFVVVRDGNIWQVDVAKRTFLLFDKAALGNQHDAMEGRLQAMLQRLPPAQRAAMETRMHAMIQHTAETKVSFTDTGRTDHVRSWSCEVWQLQHNGQTVSDACIAPAGALVGGSELVASTHNAATIAAEVLGSLPVAHVAAQRMALYANADGFPVRTRNLYGGEPEDEEIVSSIDNQALPADKFAVPRGFTRTTLGDARD